MEERTFYATAYKSGKQIQITVPKKHIDKLGIEGRDELKVTISKTGHINEKVREPKKTFKETIHGDTHPKVEDNEEQEVV